MARVRVLGGVKSLRKIQYNNILDIFKGLIMLHVEQMMLKNDLWYEMTITVNVMIISCTVSGLVFSLFT